MNLQTLSTMIDVVNPVQYRVRRVCLRLCSMHLTFRELAMFPVLIIVLLTDPFIISILMLVTQVRLLLVFKKSWFNPADNLKITGNNYM